MKLSSNYLLEAGRETASGQSRVLHECELLHERKSSEPSGDAAFQISWWSWWMDTIAFFLSFYSHTLFLSALNKDRSQIRPWNKDLRGSTRRNHTAIPHSVSEMRPELLPTGRQHVAVWHKRYFMWRLLLPQPAAAFHVHTSLCSLCSYGKPPAVEPCSAAWSWSNFQQACVWEALIYGADRLAMN